MTAFTADRLAVAFLVAVLMVGYVLITARFG